MTDDLDYDRLRSDTVRQVAKLMAAAAITAPKSGGQLFLAGKHLFIERVIVDDRNTLDELAAWMRARGRESREAIWFRDAEAAEAIDAVLFVGLADWYSPVYDCGACGYATCAEFMHATRQLRRESEELEFIGPQCNLRDIDLGIAVGSAAKTAAVHSIDARGQTRIAVAARKLGLIKADVAVALSLSLTHKAVGFDRRLPDVDFDSLDLPPTGTLPLGVPGAGARGWRQEPAAAEAFATRDRKRKRELDAAAELAAFHQEQTANRAWCSLSAPFNPRVTPSARHDLRLPAQGRGGARRRRRRLVSLWRGMFDLQPDRDGMEGGAKVIVFGDPSFEVAVRDDMFLDTYPPTGARALAAVRPLRTLPPGAPHGRRDCAAAGLPLKLAGRD